MYDLPCFQIKTKKLQFLNLSKQVKFPFFQVDPCLNKHVIAESSKGPYSFYANQFCTFLHPFCSFVISIFPSSIDRSTSLFAMVLRH